MNLAKDPIPYEVKTARKAEPFLWPAPPYCEWRRGGTSSGGKAEDCLLVFRDGTKTVGRLTSFLSEQGLLKFKAGDAGTEIRVAFTSLLRMSLLKPAELKYQDLPEGLANQDVSPHLER